MGLTKENLKILSNIISGVESGGQQYSTTNKRYSAYAAPYTNSNKEVTVTLGWAQNYGNEGRKLCQMIFKKDPVAFRKADTANIEKMLSVDWVATKWAPTASQKKALIAIITTDAGKECQDELFYELMEKYVKRAEEFGVTDVGAIMMWCECQHLGGLTPTQRVFKRAAKPYTVDSIFASLLKDQNDTSNNNQIGDKKFQSRHECCVKWIKQYVKTTTTSTSTTNKGGDTKMTVNDLINKLIAIFKGEDGYLEKASNSNLDSKKANAGSRNYTKYWRDLANWGLGNYQAQYWCAAFIHWCFVKAFGLANAKKLLLHAPYISCQTGYEKFKAKGRVYSSPKVGDIVVFWNGSRYSHTEFVIGVNGKTFSTCGGNTAVSGAVANGGGVFYGKTYTLNTSKHKFLRPDYASILGSVSTTPTTTPSSSTTASKVSGKIDTVKEVQKWLNSNYKSGLEADGIYGAKTKKALVKALQTELNQTYKAGLVVDGIWGSKTRAAIRSLSVGSNNDVVKVLQAALVCNGYSSAYVDGEYGNGTASAVKSYQSKKGLSADGIAGQQTFESLCK